MKVHGSTNSMHRSTATQSISQLGEQIKRRKQLAKLATTQQSGTEKVDLQGKRSTSPKQPKSTVGSHTTTTHSLDTTEQLNEVEEKILSEPVSVTTRIHVKLGSVHTLGDFYEGVLMKIIMTIPLIEEALADFDPTITLTGVDFEEPEDTPEEYEEDEIAEQEPIEAEDMAGRTRGPTIEEMPEDQTPEYYDEEPEDAEDLKDTEREDQLDLERENPTQKKRKLM